MSDTRRELQTRKYSWVQQFAAALSRTFITPNQISVLSIFCAGFSLFSLYRLGMWPESFWAWAAVAGIQLRLFCNLMDGLVAIEGKKKSIVGDLYNDVPDRISDVLILGGFVFALRGFPWGASLAYLTAIAAVLTAYVRYVGASLTGKHFFIGPMAKQHRMFFCSLALLITPFERMLFPHLKVHSVLFIMMLIVLAGALFTCARRLLYIVKELKARA